MRLQVGWLDDHPLRIPCGRCGILIFGTAFFDQKKAGLRYEIKNASSIDESNPDFYIEASAELLTEKLRPHKGPYHWSPPPFFQNLWAMGNEHYSDFKGRALQFLALCKTEWPTVRRVNELWLKGQHSYLRDQLRNYLPEKQFPLTNIAELLRGVHQLNLLFVWPLLDSTRFDRATKTLFKILPLLAQKYSKSLTELVAHFEESGLLLSFEEKILRRIGHLVETFKFLLPVLALRFYEKRPRNLFTQKGTTTSSVDDVKSFYSDSFEELLDIAILHCAYNNLSHRGSFRSMASKRKDIVTLADLQAKAKGDRLQFVTDKERFDFLFRPGVDNRLRNALAHASYSYDAVTQRISYYPSGVQGKGECKKIYLMNLLERCWDAFLITIDYAELIYQTRKLYYVLVKGEKTVHPRVFQPGG